MDFFGFGATICTREEIQSLPYAGLWFAILTTDQGSSTVAGNLGRVAVVIPEESCHPGPGVCLHNILEGTAWSLWGHCIVTMALYSDSEGDS